jgi:hypothetical protein
MVGSLARNYGIKTQRQRTKAGIYIPFLLAAGQPKNLMRTDN